MIAPGSSIGDAVAVSGPAYGSAYKYEGLYKVDPMAMMPSAAKMLRRIGEKRASTSIGSPLATPDNHFNTANCYYKRGLYDQFLATTSGAWDFICNKLKEATYHA